MPFGWRRDKRGTARVLRIAQRNFSRCGRDLDTRPVITNLRFRQTRLIFSRSVRLSFSATYPRFSERCVIELSLEQIPADP